MNISQNIALFQELIRCGSPISSWVYDADGDLLSSNCPDENLFAAAFSIMGVRDQMLAHAQQNTSPILLGSSIGMNWGAAFDWEKGKLHACYVIGPVFFSEVSVKEAEYGFRPYESLDIGLAWKHRFFKALDRVPLAQHIILSRYTLMLHYCLTGQRLEVSDLSILNSTTPAGVIKTDERDSHSVWRTEQAMLQMVSDGDLNYQKALNASILSSNGVPIQGRDPLRQAKTSIIVFTSLVCRAAIEGGLSPTEAYSLGNHYIQSAENATSLNDLSSLALTMYDDFIHRVHQRRIDPKVSEPIRKCCDYIDMHLDQKLKAADLAALSGYTEYYFTYKFKNETGQTINSYIRHAKIQRAKVLLLSGDEDICKISEDLGFGSRSYFSKVFMEETGCTPTRFRAAHRQKEDQSP